MHERFTIEDPIPRISTPQTQSPPPRLSSTPTHRSLPVEPRPPNHDRYSINRSIPLHGRQLRSRCCRVPTRGLANVAAAMWALSICQLRCPWTPRRTAPANPAYPTPSNSQGHLSVWQTSRTSRQGQDIATRLIVFASVPNFQCFASLSCGEFRTSHGESSDTHRSLH